MSKLWKKLNTKSSSAHLRLNDNDIRPIRSREDENFTFVSKMAETFESMGLWCRNVTSPTINQQYLCCFLCYLAWNLWYCRIFSFLRQLLVYTAGAFQSDEFEGEFGIYRGMSCTSYFISVNQILASVRLRQRKLFHSLQIATSDHAPSSCCTEPISDAEKEEIDNCLIYSSTLSDNEKFLCFYVADFLARRGNFPSNDDVYLPEDTSESEFFSCKQRKSSFASRMVVPVCLKLLLFL